MKKKSVHKLAARWLEKLGIPEGKIKVAVGDEEWREAGNESPLSPYRGGKILGRTMDPGPGFGIAHYQEVWRSIVASVIVHEIAHILWLNKPHWWIECFGEKVAPKFGREGTRLLISSGEKRYVGRYSKRYGHEIDELPSRKKCIEMARKRARRLWPEPPTAS